MNTRLPECSRMNFLTEREKQRALEHKDKLMHMWRFAVITYLRAALEAKVLALWRNTFRTAINMGFGTSGCWAPRSNGAHRLPCLRF